MKQILVEIDGYTEQLMLAISQQAGYNSPEPWLAVTLSNILTKPVKVNTRSVEIAN